jgi:hypothetical protein
MRTKDKYVQELAETASKLFEGGITNPTAEDIAEANFPGRALGGEIAEGVRKRLHQIRDVLFEDYDYLVCLLSRKYYIKHESKEPPANLSEARKCIPVGAGVKTVGIHLFSGDDDLIWQAAVQHNLATGGGKFKKSVDITVNAVSDGLLEAGTAGAMLREGQKRAEAESPALVEGLVAELPEGEDSESVAATTA